MTFNSKKTDFIIAYLTLNDKMYLFDFSRLLFLRAEKKNAPWQMDKTRVQLIMEIHYMFSDVLKENNIITYIGISIPKRINLLI